MSNRDLTKGPVSLKLLQLAGPMVFAIVAVISVSLVDTYYIGKLGTEPLAAISFSFPITLALTSLSIGLSAGSASVIARTVGRDDQSRAKRLSTDALILSTLLVLIIATTGYLTLRPLFSLLGAEDEVLEMAIRYMRIWYISMPFLVVPMVANAIIRAVGDAFWPSLIMIGSAAVNIIMTPIFVFGWGPIPAFDIEGAAIGTLISYVFTMFTGLYLLLVREKMITRNVPPFKTLWKSWKSVLEVALPAAFGNAVNPIGVTIVTGIVATYGTFAVAGFGVASRIESFAVIPMLALSSAIGPIAGQNWGGKKYERIISAFQLSYCISLIWSLLLATIFWFAAEPIVGIFTNEKQVIENAISYLHIVPLSIWGYGCVIIASGGYNALGKPYTGLGFYLIRSAVLYVPLSFFASMFFQDWGIFVAIAISNAISGTVAVAYSLYWLKKFSGNNVNEDDDQRHLNGDDHHDKHHSPDPAPS